MKRGGYDSFLTGLLIVLTIAIISTSLYLTYKYFEKNKLNSDANEFLNELDTIISENDELLYDQNLENEAIKEQTSGSNGVRGISSNSLKYKGYDVAGKLEMPTVRLQYPVLAETTDANAIEVSVAIQYGVGLNNIGNTVIIGHNYRSGLFFGSNKKMQLGDKIYITDYATRTRREYEVYNKYTTEENDTTYYNRNTNGKREVSLVTCQSNNKYRLVIWAREV